MTYAHELSAAAARPTTRGWTTRLAWAGALVCAGSVTLAMVGAPSDAAFGRGLLQLLIVGVPIVAGLYALREPAGTSFAAALLAIGFLWSLTALTTSEGSVAFTIGRLTTWLILPGAVYLLLAFPHGRIAPGLDRALFAGVLAVMALLFFGTAPFVAGFPGKTLWSSCTTDCPANALFVLQTQPPFLAKVVLVREWLVEALWVGLFYSMLRRWRAASPLQRQAMGPAFVAGALLGAFQCAHITSRQLGLPADTVIALSSAWTLCIVALCGGFLFGMVRRRMLLAQALAALGPGLRAREDRTGIRDALRTALGDMNTEVLFRDGGSDGWSDAGGRVVERPLDPGPNRAITEAAEVERVRIQRDLHDGAQQRLIALRIRLNLAEDLLATDPAAGMSAIHRIGVEAERALDDLRSLAREVHPPQLTAMGLPGALHAVASQAPLPVHLSADGVGRHPIEVESAVYFTCVEALQNAVKHARGATGVWINLRQSRRTLRFEVRDDGAGFVPGDHHDERGLRNMRDRMEAVGGQVSVDAKPGAGARVNGAVHLA